MYVIRSIHGQIDLGWEANTQTKEKLKKCTQISPPPILNTTTLGLLHLVLKLLFVKKTAIVYTLLLFHKITTSVINGKDIAVA
mmetsp:Transcript_28705/g.29048  ORF Transcript_28705/g.29048 Transcript_28705/m.29048 type:complete len:83 (-) Transcript_28705:196-444(-)